MSRTDRTVQRHDWLQRVRYGTSEADGSAQILDGMGSGASGYRGDVAQRKQGTQTRRWSFCAAQASNAGTTPARAPGTGSIKTAPTAMDCAKLYVARPAGRVLSRAGIPAGGPSKTPIGVRREPRRAGWGWDADVGAGDLRTPPVAVVAGRPQTSSHASPIRPAAPYHSRFTFPGIRTWVYLRSASGLMTLIGRNGCRADHLVRLSSPTRTQGAHDEALRLDQYQGPS